MSNGTFYDGALTANPMRVAKTPDGYDLRTVDQHLQRIEADFAVYRRATDAKLADHHTELVQLRTQFRKLFDAVGKPGITPPVDDWIIDE